MGPAGLVMVEAFFSNRSISWMSSLSWDFSLELRHLVGEPTLTLAIRARWSRQPGLEYYLDKGEIRGCWIRGSWMLVR